MGRKLATIAKLSTVWQLTKNVIHGIEENDLLESASELAFNFLLALFPLLLFMLALFGLFASRSYQLQSGLLSYFAHFLPPAAFQLLKEITIELAANATRSKLTLSIVLSLWFASGGMSSMISTLNAAYHVRETRSWLKIRAIAFGLTLAISILLFTALVIVPLGGQFVDWIGIKLHFGNIIVMVWKRAAVGGRHALCDPIVFADLLLRTDANQTPGLGHTRFHFFGAFLWLAASISRLPAFRQYIFGSYGSIGALMILLVWAVRHRLSFSHRRGDQRCHRVFSCSRLP